MTSGGAISTPYPHCSLLRAAHSDAKTIGFHRPAGLTDRYQRVSLFPGCLLAGGLTLISPSLADLASTEGFFKFSLFLF